MKTSYKFVSMTEMLIGGEEPSIVVQKKGLWAASQGHLLGGDSVEWVTAQGDMIRIPMLRYRVTSRLPMQAIGHAFELGMWAILTVPNRPSEVLIVLGDPLGAVANSLEFWMGLAVKL
jgi:hypothetical protein